VQGLVVNSYAGGNFPTILAILGRILTAARADSTSPDDPEKLEAAN